MAGKVYEIGFKIAGDLSGNFQKTFKAANTAVQNFNKNLNLVNKSAADVSALIKQKQEVANASRAYIQAKEKVAQLGRAMSQTKNPTKEMVAEFNRAKTALDKTKRALDTQRNSLRTLESQTGITGASLKTLINRENELARAAERAKAAQAAQAKANGAMSANNATLSSTAGYASMAGAAAGAGIVKSINIGAAFESEMARVAAVSRASNEELAKMTKTARELGATTVWSSSEAAQGMQYLAMAGFKTNEIIDTMPGMLSLASAGAIDLGAAADISSNILTGFGLSAADMARVGDVLTNTFTSSNTTLEGLGNTMKYAAPVAKAMGVSIEEAAAMAGKLGDAGIQGEMAGTTLRSVLLRLSAPSAAGAKALEELGVSATDSAGNMRAYPEILKDLNKAMSGMSEGARAEMTKTIFETEAMSGALVLMEQAGSGSLDKFIQDVKVVGSAEQTATKQTDTFTGDMKALASASEEVALKIYDSLKPALRDLAQQATVVVQKVGAWAAENPGLVSGIMKVGSGVAILAAAALPMVAAMKTAQFIFAAIKAPILAMRAAIAACRMGMLLYNGTLAAGTAVTKGARVASLAYAAAAKVMAAGQWLLNAALNANPIVKVITLLTGLVAVGILVYKNWDTIKAKAVALWTTFSEKFPSIAGIFSEAFGRVKAIASDVKGVFTNLIGFVKNVFAGNWAAAWENVKNTFGHAFSALVGLVKLPFQNIISLVNKAIKGINSAVGKVKIPDWVPAFGGKSFNMNIPTIPQLAEGGIATRSTLANIGEGREAEAVLPLSRLDSMLSNKGQGNGPISVSFAPTINVNGGGDVKGDVQNALNAGLADLEKRIERIMANKRRLSFA